MRKEDAQQMSRDWLRQARGGRAMPAAKASPYELKMMGIGVRRSKRKKREQDGA